MYYFHKDIMSNIVPKKGGNSYLYIRNEKEDEDKFRRKW